MENKLILIKQALPIPIKSAFVETSVDKDFRILTYVHWMRKRRIIGSARIIMIKI